MQHRAQQLEIGLCLSQPDFADEIEQTVKHRSQRAVLVFDDLDSPHGDQREAAHARPGRPRGCGRRFEGEGHRTRVKNQGLRLKASS
jgi:hypothetical protein